MKKSGDGKIDFYKKFENTDKETLRLLMWFRELKQKMLNEKK